MIFSERYIQFLRYQGWTADLLVDICFPSFMLRQSISDHDLFSNRMILSCLIQQISAKGIAEQQGSSNHPICTGRVSSQSHARKSCLA